MKNTEKKNTNYYVIKVEVKEGSYRGEVYYKIGEGNLKRPQELIRKYSKLRNIEATLLECKELPRNEKLRLNDKTIHANIEDQLKKVDARIIQALLKENDGSSEFFTTNLTTEETISYINEVVKELGKDEHNFTAEITLDTKYLRIHYENDGKTHVVTEDKLEQMLNAVDHSLTKLTKLYGKTLFLVGQFNRDIICCLAGYFNKIVILTDSEDQRTDFAKVIMDKIVYVDTLKELIDMNKYMDLVLSNPPYKMGNAITSAIVNNVNYNDFVNLMPCSYYRDKDLYAHVDSIQQTKDDFNDAAVGDSLTIAVLKKNCNVYSSYEELENCKRNPEYQEYYKLNVSYPSRYYTKLRPKVTDGPSFNNDTTFVTGIRVCYDGVHKTTNCYDYKFNIAKTIDYTGLHEDNGAYTAWIMQFTAKQEKDNFMRFWYDNPLMHKLLKGLNKSIGTPNAAIPNINWSISDRDYEHATLEDIMNWLREDNNISA